MLVDLFERVVLLQQPDGGLGADAGDAGDVVAGVADKRLVIDNLVGAHAELLHDRIVVVNLRLRAGAVVGKLDADVVVHKLQDVLVSGDDEHGHALLRRLPGDGADHVVGLVAFTLQNGHVERLHDLADALNLDIQLVGHLFARAFVVGIQLVALGQPLVEGDGEVLGRIVGEQDVQQGAGEAVGGVGRLARLRGERVQREGKKDPVSQGVAINKNEFWGAHTILFLPSGAPARRQATRYRAGAFVECHPVIIAHFF